MRTKLIKLKYIFYFIIFLLILIILFFVLEIKFKYLFANKNNNSSYIIGKFIVSEDENESIYFNKYSNEDKVAYKKSVEKNLNRLIYFENESSFDSKYGICKHGYFNLDYIYNKKRCDKFDIKDDLCHRIFNVEYPSYSFSFICSSDDYHYNLILLKNKSKEIIWLDNDGFYFKLKKID